VTTAVLAGSALLLLTLILAIVTRWRPRHLWWCPDREAVDLDPAEEREFEGVARMASRGQLVPHPREGG
jgi:hypothetical protein